MTCTCTGLGELPPTILTLDQRGTRTTLLESPEVPPEARVLPLLPISLLVRLLPSEQSLTTCQRRGCDTDVVVGRSIG